MNEIVFPEFPYYLEVYEYMEDDSVKVVVHSKIHESKEVVMPHSWTPEYRIQRHRTFRTDIKSFVIQHYGLEKQPESYM